MNLRSVLDRILPRRRTSDDEVKAAMIEVGIDPTKVGWSVYSDGLLAVGRQHPEGPGGTYGEVVHLLAWARRRRVKLHIIGWEQQADMTASDHELT